MSGRLSEEWAAAQIVVGSGVAGAGAFLTRGLKSAQRADAVP
jgi:hypothetical protein